MPKRQIISDVQDLKTIFLFCNNMIGFGETYSTLYLNLSGRNYCNAREDPGN